LPKSKLKKKDKDLIYKLYKEENFPQKNLAQLYDTSQSTISNIIKEKKYEEKELKDKNLLTDSRYNQNLLN